MEKKITCPGCKREFVLPENYQPTIITESDNSSKKVFICPCCRRQIKIE